MIASIIVIGRMCQGLEITGHVGAPLIDAQKVGVTTSQHRIATVHSDTIDVATPTPRQDSSTPPYIKVKMHTEDESSVPFSGASG